jgi:Rad52/22 family double-strand break repair protein
MPKSAIELEPDTGEQQALVASPATALTTNGSIDEIAFREEQFAAVRDLLTQRTPKSEIRIREGRGSMKQRYVDHAYVTRTLNLAFKWHWNFTILEDAILEVNEKFFEATCRGRLEVWFPGDPTPVIKEQYGSQPIEYMRDGVRPVSLGDARKGAASDALKKCASLLGVALDIYDSDFDFTKPAQDEKPKQAAKKEGEAENAPMGDPAKPTEEELLEAAQAIVNKGGVEKKGDSYVVLAPHHKTGSAKEYFVTKKDGVIICNCPDGTGQPRCLHRLAVVLFATTAKPEGKPEAKPEPKGASLINEWASSHPSKWKVKDKTLRDELIEIWMVANDAGMTDQELKGMLGIKSGDLRELHPDDAQDFVVKVSRALERE